MKTDIANMKVE